MPYLVRKLIKRKNIDLIKDTSKMETIISDVPTSEFRTTNGFLSTMNKPVPGLIWQFPH